MEHITITLTMATFKGLGLQPGSYEVKSVRVVDDVFKEDELHKALKRKADSAYKALQEYEFKKRHNIK